MPLHLAQKLCVTPLVLTTLALAGCNGGGSSAPANGSSSSGGSSGKTVLTFWHTRRGSQETALKAICEDYEKQHPEIDLQPEYQGSYDDLNKKLTASIQAKRLPTMTVAYENHVATYMANGVVRELDDLVKDPELGFTPEELSDIPEQYLESNRFAQFGGKLLSFPFTKSNLVFYYNRDLLKKAGFDAPAATWPEFEKQATALSRLTKGPAWSWESDPSTLDGLVYSFGSPVLDKDGKSTLFNSPAAVQMFTLLQRAAKNKILAEDEGDEAEALFTGQRRAFVLTTSSARKRTEDAIAGKFDWDITLIPHAEGVAPVTVMYGPNICLFKSTPEVEKAAWQFVKFFVSPEVTARWARETGYLPVRKSAVTLPEMRTFYEQNPRAKHVYDTMAVAQGEPNVVGWQEVRNALETTAREVISGKKAPAAAAQELKTRADAILKQSEQSN
jgi:ABC-type glycerol-3-phosphate transport system substrate-binding protein